MNSILKQIEKTRDLMIQSGVQNGLQNTETIRLSKRLDRLHNIYNKKQGYQPKQSFQHYHYKS